MTNATDKLRKLLDERGIVWMDVRRMDVRCPTFFRTCWKTGDAAVYCYFDEEKSTGVIELTISGYDFTPEQAIAATLGGERERELELLVKQLWYLVNHRSGYGYAAALESIEELGIEVEQ